MRVLLAADGSEQAVVACDLAASTSWPEGSLVRLVAVVEQPVGVIPTPWLAPGPGNLRELHERLMQNAASALDATAADLRGHGLGVETVIREGRAASAIVDEARSFEADLIVVGSRGHGPISTILLGSTSAEVVDHAPCAVLVARRREVGDVLVADDGSQGAARALAAIEAIPGLAGGSVAVLSVAEVAGPWIVGVAPTMYDDVLAAYAADIAAARDQAQAIARAGAERLIEAGHRAEAIVAEGDAAHRILETAEARGSGLIVLGTRGRTGLVRAVLGSVARNVLLHARASVLIVR